MFQRLLGIFAVATTLTGCTVGFDADPPGKFSCEMDSDCIPPNECGPDGTCGPAFDPGCVDLDGDGYGVGEPEQLAVCAACESQGHCAEDCNDDDPAVNPGAQDTCDGTDNDCDGEVDEPISCETSMDCPAEGDLLFECADGTCVYKPAIQPANAPECREPLACVDGTHEDPPAACM